MNKGSVLICAGVMVFGFGCIDSLSEEDSQKGFMAANAVLMQGGSQAQASGLVAVDFDFNCLEGGSASFAGSFDEATADNTTFNYNVTFDNCISQGVTLSGSMTYFLSFATTESTSSLVYSYNGDIGFAGQVDGDCPISMTARVDTATSQTGGNFSYEYSGTLCGNEAGFMNSGSFNFDFPN